ncbi:hypothetical protein MMC25_004368 [Agyrium rufum]|nr:hypothetical protein [Agyrium rufum]
MPKSKKSDSGAKLFPNLKTQNSAAEGTPSSPLLSSKSVNLPRLRSASKRSSGAARSPSEIDVTRSKQRDTNSPSPSLSAQKGVARKPDNVSKPTNLPERMRTRSLSKVESERQATVGDSKEFHGDEETSGDEDMPIQCRPYRLVNNGASVTLSGGAKGEEEDKTQSHNPNSVIASKASRGLASNLTLPQKISALWASTNSRSTKRQHEDAQNELRSRKKQYERPNDDNSNQDGSSLKDTPTLLQSSLYQVDEETKVPARKVTELQSTSSRIGNIVASGAESSQRTRQGILQPPRTRQQSTREYLEAQINAKRGRHQEINGKMVYLPKVMVGEVTRSNLGGRIIAKWPLFAEHFVNNHLIGWIPRGEVRFAITDEGQKKLDVSGLDDEHPALGGPSRCQSFTDLQVGCTAQCCPDHTPLARGGAGQWPQRHIPKQVLDPLLLPTPPLSCIEQSFKRNAGDDTVCRRIPIATLTNANSDLRAIDAQESLSTKKPIEIPTEMKSRLPERLGITTIGAIDLTEAETRCEQPSPGQISGDSLCTAQGNSPKPVEGAIEVNTPVLTSTQQLDVRGKFPRDREKAAPTESPSHLDGPY